MVPPRRSAARTWWVYILQCGDGTLYTGIALDPAARLAQHREGAGARYTRGRAPLEMVYREAVPGRAAATRREAEIKRCTRREKLALIRRGGLAAASDRGCALPSEA